MRLKVLVAIAAALAIVFVYRTFVSPPRAFGEALAYTECPFRGEARVTVTSRVAPEDTFPVRMHEEVHAAQCRDLGPLRYRVRNLTGRGRLSLEAPAYCAGARARIRLRMDGARVRERLVDDTQAAFGSDLDSMQVREAVRASCPDLFGGPRISP